ncbi:hypothetical protein BWQ96_04003 [Gracilariopsis chorda]|uniref:Uncharacterized protein n=1 Tax=Gracilariopsis chorda TaxID=448386 RepID=A0A2V3IVP5_9FLOR|nr:hypothetical protein BWQ96_04003 [Gracilariopsis chorda]|eukprot:PXF46218.1 hypothetical protein BWQ96_04003 [Gracilariopsis chorda]
MVVNRGYLPDMRLRVDDDDVSALRWLRRVGGYKCGKSVVALQIWEKQTVMHVTEAETKVISNVDDRCTMWYDFDKS